MRNTKPEWKVPVDMWNKKKLSEQQSLFLKDVLKEETQSQPTKENNIDRGKQVSQNIYFHLNKVFFCFIKRLLL